MEKTPQQVAAVEHLRAWGAGPKGRALFGWGTPGDFEKCRAFYRDKMPARMIAGWCARLHRMATGAVPGHAPAELAAKKRH